MDRREEELVNALKNGDTIRQIIGHYRGYWPKCSPFLPQYNTPEYIGHHLYLREHVWGLDTLIIRR